MLSRWKSLERLAALYQAVEHTRGMALDQATAAVREVEAAIDSHAGLAERLKDDGLQALRAGDQAAWRMDESQRELTEWSAGPLHDLRQRREELMRSAAELYRSSRMQAEQMESVLDGLRGRMALERSRAQQRESDDRFLARQRCLERDRLETNPPQERESEKTASSPLAGPHE